MNTKVTQLRINQLRINDLDREMIDHALAFAYDAHEGQLRKSGDPYIIHPLAVAQTVHDWGLDAEAIAAALLHDTVEDTPVTLEDIKTGFGPNVARLVDGLTKLSAITATAKSGNDSTRRDISMENLRKLLLASTEDLRVLILKLADRRHNLQTLQYLGADKRQRIAIESLEVYAPLADRLGMGQIKAEIEDLAFRYAMPGEFAQTAQLVAGATRANQRYLRRIKRDISDQLAEAGLEPISIEARQKHLYSVHKKLAKVDGDISKIYDLVAVRIIIDGVAACYQTLGVLHQRYRPLIYRIKDYIAVPKPNGYRSLHTTVFAIDGRITEIQIRTPEMHHEAEQGLAAHFYYDAQKSSNAYQRGEVGRVPGHLAWVRDLAEIGKSIQSGQELDASTQVELFADRIFVFSPKGDLYELPEGATPLDFAFAVHSDIGLRTMGAKVNGRMVPLDTRLDNRDVVEITTRREPTPNRDWLGFVQTSGARSKIRAWFRAVSRDTNIASGRTAVEEALPAWGYRRLEDVPAKAISVALADLNLADKDSLLAAVGEGAVTVGAAMRRLFPPPSERPAEPQPRTRKHDWRVVFAGGHLPYTLAPCCQPSYPHRVVGYVTRGSGVTVHRRKCVNLPEETNRYVACHWQEVADSQPLLQCRLGVVAVDRVGLLQDITTAVAKEDVSISGMQSSDNQNQEAEINFGVQVADLHALSLLMQRLRRLNGVTRVYRIQ